MKLSTLVKLTAVAVASSQALSVSAAPWATPDYYQCYNRTAWDYGMGLFGPSCDIEPWGTTAVAEDQFLPLVFDQNTGSETAERARYMNEMHAMLKEAVAYYIKKRRPDVTDEEVEVWQRANFAKAEQETYWTHYRRYTDGNIKMIRGDYGHGHGLVQIDDRWHFDKITEGAGWHIFMNIVYGMDIFYSEWQNAASAWCVSSPSDWTSRARSAYSAYNGGPTKICRWTDPYDYWAQNDVGYLDKYVDQNWYDYIGDVNLQTTVDVPCNMESGAACGLTPPVDPEVVENWTGYQINLTSGEACIYTDGKLECVESSADLGCLEAQLGDVAGSLYPSAEILATVESSVNEKHTCYAAAVDGLQTIGQAVKAKIAVTMRDSAGGTSLDQTAVSEKVYQVLDYTVNDITNDQHRYYAIKEGDKQGYIYAGSALNNEDWAVAASAEELTEVVIPFAGDEIEITAENGISVRDVPSGEYLTIATNGAVLTVEDVVVQNTDNYVYYKVTVEGVTGYIYGGKILNGNTLVDWAKAYVPAPPKPEVTYPEVGEVVEIANVAGISLRATPGGTYLTAIPAGTQVFVFDKVVQGTMDYTYYQVTYNGQTGYVYGGQSIETETTLDSWVKISEVADVAEAGQVISNISDANMRATAGGDYVQTIPAGNDLTVISNLVRGSNNYTYYEVSYNGKTGFIYSGYLSPASTVASWTIIK